MNRLMTAMFGMFLLASGGICAEAPKELSKDGLKALLASANKPADHLRLAKHFEAKALKYEAEAAEHTDLAKTYRARPAGTDKHVGSPDTAAHCDYLVESLSKAAKESRALAAAHTAMAKM